MVALDPNLKIDVVIRSLSELPRIKKELGSMLGRVKLLDTGVGTLGNRLGFLAFQFTFLAGVAGRALGEITNNIRTFVGEALDANDAIIRAVAFSGADLINPTEETVKAIELATRAIKDLGSGRTIFSQKEVASGFEEIARAGNFAGTELQQTAQAISVLKGAIILATIEGGNLNQIALDLTKTVKQFGINAAETDKVVGILTATNTDSSITLRNLSRSISIVASLSNEFGVSVEETSALVGVLADRMGILNSAAGRGLRGVFLALTDSSNAFNKQLQALGIELFDLQTGEFKGMLNAFRGINEAMSKQPTLIRRMILQLVGGSKEVATNILNITQNLDELERALDNIEKGKVLAPRLADVLANTPKQLVKRLQNAIDSIKENIVEGLSEPLKEVLNSLRDIALAPDIQEFFRDFGRVISDEILPVIKTLIKGLRTFGGMLRKNEDLMRAVAKAGIILAGVLTALFILGTVGALVSAMISGLGRLAGAIGITTVFTAGLIKALLLAIAVAAPFIVAVKAIDDIVRVLKDGFQPEDLGIIALDSAIAALSITLGAFLLKASSIRGALIGAFTSPDVTAGIDGLKSRISRAFTPVINPIRGFFGMALPNEELEEAKAKLKAFGFDTGKSFGEKLTDGFTAVKGGIVNTLVRVFGSLKNAGIVGAIAAATAAIAIYLSSINDQLKDFDDIIKTGVVDRWDIATDLIERDIVVAFNRIGNALRDFGLFFGNVLLNIAQSFSKAMIFVGSALRNALSGNIDLAIVDAQRAAELLKDVFVGVFEDIGDERGFFLKKFKEIALAFKQSGLRDSRILIQELKSFASNTTLSETTIQELINEALRDVFDVTLPAEIVPGIPALPENTIQELDAKLRNVATTADDFIPTFGDMKDTVILTTGTMSKNNQVLEENIKAANEAAERDSERAAKILGHTKEIQNNINEVINNSGILRINTQNDKELGKSILDYNVVLDKTGIAFNKLAVEATELARRLSTFALIGTIRVSGTGKPKFSGTLRASLDERQTTTTFEDIASLEEGLGSRLSNLKKTTQRAIEGIKTIDLVENLGVGAAVARGGTLVATGGAGGTLPSIDEIITALQEANRIGARTITFENNITIGATSGVTDRQTAEDIAEDILEIMRKQIESGAFVQ